MTTRFDKLIEDFNILPKSQNAVQSGPDIGMTTGDIEGTFPNRGSVVMGNLLPDDVQFKFNKEHAKEIYKLLSYTLKY